MRRSQQDRPAKARQPLPPGFGVIWTTVALDLLGFGIILPILPIYGERFGAGPATIGLLVAAFSAAQFVCAPLLGKLSDRIGRKPVILISLFGTAAGSFLTGAAVGLWMLFLGRLVDGASGASVSVAQGAVTDVAPPDQRPRLLGLLGAAFGVGFVIGPPLGGLAALVGPRVPFFVAGALALVNALVAIKRLPETNPALVSREPAHDLSSALPDTGATIAVSSSPATVSHETSPAEGGAVPDAGGAAAPGRLTRLLVVAFAATAAFAGFEATFSLLGQRRFDLTEGSVTPVFFAIGIGLVIVQGGVVGRVTDRLGPNHTLRAALVLNAAGLLVLAFAHTWLVLAIALALLVVGQGLATPTLTTVVAGRAPEDERGHALGKQQSAGALARIIGPIVAGLLFQHVSIAAPYLVGAALVGVALALLVTERVPAATKAALSD